jgi:hypothetical protein
MTENRQRARRGAEMSGAGGGTDDGFFRPMLALAELCHSSLQSDAAARRPWRCRCACRPGELAAIVDADARRTTPFPAFRSAVVGAGGLEAYYLRLVRAAADRRAAGVHRRNRHAASILAFQ